jgi:tetratricopeptide (TPR) repeat protein
MIEKWKIPGLLLALGLVVAVVYLRTPVSESVPVHPAAGPSTTSAVGSDAVETEPSGSNVSHAYRREEARLQQVLEEAPDDTTALVQLARFYQDGHQPEQAVPHYDRYTQLHPRNHQAWMDLTACFAELMQWDQALKALEAMLRIWPDDPAAMYNIGAIHANAGEFDAARTWWEKVRDGSNDEGLVRKATEQIARL